MTMQRQVLEEEEEEPCMEPYKYSLEVGDCADARVYGVTKKQHGDQFAIRVAGRTLVKHAP